MVDLIHPILYTHHLPRIRRLMVTSSWHLLCSFHTWACWNNLLTRMSGFLGTFPVFGFQFLHWKSCLRKFPSPGVNQDSFSPCFYLGCFSHGLPTVYSQWIQGDPSERQSFIMWHLCSEPFSGSHTTQKSYCFQWPIVGRVHWLLWTEMESWFWAGWCWGTHEMLN